MSAYDKLWHVMIDMGLEAEFHPIVGAITDYTAHAINNLKVLRVSTQFAKTGRLDIAWVSKAIHHHEECVYDFKEKSVYNRLKK